MAEPAIVERVKTEFGYLFDYYDYRVIAHKVFDNSGNWIVVLQSPSAGRFLAMQDRDEIILAFGPDGPSTKATGVPWFDLAVVVEYLSQGKDMVDPVSGHPQHQLAQLAGILLPYMDQVRVLFGGSRAFERARPDLDRIGTRREQELENQ
jgi:hypothetical protein